MNQKYILIIAVIVLLGIGGYYVATKKAEAPTVQNQQNVSADQTANWNTLTVEPGPSKIFEIKYPSNWGGSELRFSCQDPIAQVAAVISPTRTDLPGYRNVPAAYLVQFCVSNDRAILAYQGFIKAPLFTQPTEKDKILLSDKDLQSTSEYQIAQKIISSQNLQTQTNSPQAQNETAYWKTCINTKYKYEAKYPSNWKIWRPEAPEARLATCEEGLALLSFSPDIYKYPVSNIQQINIDVSDKARLSGTIYAGITSIDDYFSKNPSILQARPIIKETVIDGEKLVWLKDNSMLVFHAGSLFEFRVQNVDDIILNNFFSTFKFSPNETTNWQTYTEEGFSINYPAKLKFSSGRFYLCEGSKIGGSDSPARCETEYDLRINKQAGLDYPISAYQSFNFKNKNGVTYLAWKKETDDTYNRYIEIIVKLKEGNFVRILMSGQGNGFIKNYDNLTLSVLGDQVLSSIVAK